MEIISYGFGQHLETLPKVLSESPLQLEGQVLSSHFADQRAEISEVTHLKNSRATTVFCTFRK